MVVLTEGKNGAQAWTGPNDNNHFVCTDTSNGPIVDTVGAGDTFQAALIAWLWHHRGFHRPLDTKEAAHMLRFATKAASLNCTKSGCQPPSLSEVHAALD